MSKKLRELKARKAGLVAQASQLTAAAAAAGRDFTDDESTQFASLKAQIEGTNKQIEAEEFLAEQQASLGAHIDGDNIQFVGDRRAEDPKRGFKAFGEFAQAVRAAGQRNGSVDERLMIGAAAPSTFANESSGADGGFLIPPGFSTEIWQQSLEEDSLLPLTDNTEIGGNGMAFPKDETTPWGTDGIRTYWQSEASQATATKFKLGVSQMRLHKMITLVPITDELLSDGVAIGSYLTKKLPISIRWKTNEAILFGTGNGQPLGALYGNQNAIVVVPKDSGQANGTLTSPNISNMVARLPPGSLRRAIWLMNNDVLPALDNLALGNYPIYMPINQGVQASPYGILKGRPVDVSQHAKSFGNQGDINLLDLSYYRTITKADGIQTATSMHLYFDADATAFRAIFRIDGQPSILNPINPANGSNKLSPFVQLAAR